MTVNTKSKCTCLKVNESGASRGRSNTLYSLVYVLSKVSRDVEHFRKKLTYSDSTSLNMRKIYTPTWKYFPNNLIFLVPPFSGTSLLQISTQYTPSFVSFLDTCCTLSSPLLPAKPCSSLAPRLLAFGAATMMFWVGIVVVVVDVTTVAVSSCTSVILLSDWLSRSRVSPLRRRPDLCRLPKVTPEASVFCLPPEPPLRLPSPHLSVSWSQ